jgi:hypothetical protein
MLFLVPKSNKRCSGYTVIGRQLVLPFLLSKGNNRNLPVLYDERAHYLLSYIITFRATFSAIEKCQVEVRRRPLSTLAVFQRKSIFSAGSVRNF